MTLIEITVLLVAVMTLVGVLAPTMAATVGDVRRTRALLDMSNIRIAIQNFLASGFTIFTEAPGGTGTKMEMLYSDGDIPDVGNSPNWRTGPTTSDKDFLEDHLVLNAVGYSASWRGAYINAPVDADPWGNRYGVNVHGLDGTSDVVVLSAGPDENVDTTDDDLALTAADDDIIDVVENN